MRILLVEDSETLRKTVGATLRRSGFAVDAAADGEDGLWRACSNEYDAIVLDIMLPGLDGISVLSKLREENNNVPVLMLTAKTSVEDRIQGLNVGADDYLCKPFSLDELVARVNALVRRKYGSPTSRLEFGGLAIDRDTKSAQYRDICISLTPREFILLEYLASRSGSVVSRTEIEEHIYDELVEPGSNVVDSTICILRKKLKDAGAEAIIQTKRGHGYIFGH